jgi:hypothetical protein
MAVRRRSLPTAAAQIAITLASAKVLSIAQLQW